MKLPPYWDNIFKMRSTFHWRGIDYCAYVQQAGNFGESIWLDKNNSHSFSLATPNNIAYWISGSLKRRLLSP